VQLPTAPAANNPTYDVNPTTVSNLRAILSRPSSWVTALAATSYALGYGIGYLLDQYSDRNEQFNIVLDAVLRFDPNFDQEDVDNTWVNIYTLGTYLNELHRTYIQLYSNSCDANFDSELYDAALFNESHFAVFPHRGSDSLNSSPYSDPYEHLFPTREAYEQALIEYAQYLANGGTLSFLDWWAHVYGRGPGGSTGNSGDGHGSDPHGIYAAFENYRNEGGNQEFHRWFSSNSAADLFTANQLHDFGEANGWFSPDDPSKILYPSYSGNIDNNGFDTVLSPHTDLDRYGDENGSFLSPAGTPFGDRALPPTTDPNEAPNQYEVLIELPVTEGIAAPWFGQEGGGVQYEINWNRISEITDVPYETMNNFRGGKIAWLVSQGWLRRK